MFDINDTHAYRIAVKFIRKYGHIAEYAEIVKIIKRNMRAFARRDTHTVTVDGIAYERRIVKSYGIDGFIELVTMPHSVGTYDDAESFFSAYIKCECIPHDYDCSGQIFTAWRHIFQHNGRWCAYHYLACDV